jgi:hypothetical protein
MADVWSQVKSLEGKTLKTLRGRSFVVESVDRNTMTVIVGSTGKPRPIGRDVIENAYNAKLTPNEVSPNALRDRLGAENRNLSYVSAIVKALRKE